MKIAVIGQMAGVGGPSEACRGMAIGLKKKGHHVRIMDAGSERLTKCWFRLETEQHIMDMVKNQIANDSEYYAIHMYSPMGYPELTQRLSGAKKHIGFPWFEYNELPEMLVERMNMMDEIWLPSYHCADVAKKHGVTKPIFVVPHAINHDIFKPEGEKLKVENPRDFNFLCVGEYNGRKNILNTAVSFMNAFREEENVRLIIQTYGLINTHEATMRIMLDIRQWKERITQSIGEVKCKVHLLRHDLHESEIPQLYRAADCFVSVSRGEAFGGTILEAMACGTPVISPNVMGLKQIVNNDNAVVVRNGGMRTVKDYALIRDHPYLGTMTWADPRLDELIAHMKNIRENGPDENKVKNALETAKKYTWDSSAEKALKILTGEMTKDERPDKGVALSEKL